MKRSTLCIFASFLAGITISSFMTRFEISKTIWLPYISTEPTTSTLINNSMLPTSSLASASPPLKDFIVYDCSGEYPGPCGGWSDRMSGIFSAYVISVLLNRHFRIRYDNLTSYVAPHTFDWKYNDSILEGRTTSYQNFFCKTPDAVMKGDLASLRELFYTEVSFVRINWDYTAHFRKFPNLRKVIPWVLDLHFADIYLKFFKTLFMPTEDLQESVNKILQNVTKLACAHIRMGRSETIAFDDKHTDEKQVKHIWHFLKTIEEKDNYSIFVATDAQFVRNTAKALFNQFLEVDGRILHIDRRPNGQGIVDGYRKVVLDFFVLTKCDVLVLTKSGFGMMAAYLNTKDSDLYCLTLYEVVPCSRYTLQRFYPTQILSPV
ncbi:uncharacterized protein [Argopecten irradians]|uniref:uncharacterized protein n=1 Tax=Argopecten irradians TaxID=31199 RepID=UPI00371BE25D